MLGGSGALLIPEILRASIGCKMVCWGARRDDSFASAISDSAHIACIDSATRPTRSTLERVEAADVPYLIDSEVGTNTYAYTGGRLE